MVDHQKRKPLVSIGMPVFNGGAYLRMAVDSLLNQSFKDFELIISNNSSTDESLAICAEYAKVDDRVKVYSQPTNIGATANFEFVLNQSSGMYFMWAAADDVWDKRWLEELVGSISSKDFSVRGLVQIVDANGVELDLLRPKQYNKDNWSDFILDYNGAGVFYIYGLLHREQVVNDFDILKQGLWADALFVYKGLWSATARSVSTTKQIYRRHHQSVSAGLSKRSFLRKLLALIMVNDFRYYCGFYDLTPMDYKLRVIPVIMLRWAKDQFIHLKMILLHVIERLRIN